MIRNDAQSARSMSLTAQQNRNTLQLIRVFVNFLRCVRFEPPPHNRACRCNEIVKVLSIDRNQIVYFFYLWLPFPYLTFSRFPPRVKGGIYQVRSEYNLLLSDSNKGS